MPRGLNSQSKALVASLINYFERERDNGGPLIPLVSVRQRVADALSINKSTVCGISTEVKECRPLSSPKKTRHRVKTVTAVDDFTVVAIRNALYTMYRQKQQVTLTLLLQKLKDDEIFSGGRTSLMKILKNIGFSWKKDDPRRAMMERSDIALLRIDFLRNYVQNIKNSYFWDPVFLDETWVFENGTVGRSWQDTSVQSVKRTKIDGKRYIIVHAGNRSGFIPGASLIFPSKTKNADYHGEMNAETFLDWVENYLLRNLEKPSMIIMDNAPYHRTCVNVSPTAAWKKQDIQTWLTQNNIVYAADMLKLQLLHLVQLHKPNKIYAVDELAHQYGHRVLRLPPYHCIFNAIENIWGISKVYYNNHIGRDGSGMEKVLSMWQESIDHITTEMWSNTVNHTENTVIEWWEREIGFDQEEVLPLIINLEGESSDEEIISSSEPENEY